MAGARLIAKGVNAEDFAFEYAAPVRRGLEGMFFLNTSLEKLARNYAPGKPQGKIVGSPVANTNWATLTSNTSYIQTDISDTVEMSFFAIVRSDLQTGGPSIVPIGNYQVGDPVGVSMYSAAQDRLATTAGGGNDSSSSQNFTCSAIGQQLSVWGLYSGVITAGNISMRNHTSGVSNNTVITLPRRLSSRKLRIGSAYSAQMTGVCDMMLAQIHNVAVTEDERASTIADLRAYALRRGINV